MILTKPIAEVTAEEKTRLVARMKAAGYYDDDFVGVLGNLNNPRWTLPARVRKAAVTRQKAARRKAVKASR